MGDSDDEVDYRRRDKFHSERRGYDMGSRAGGGGSEERWEPRPLPPPTYASGYRPRPGGGGGGYGHPPPEFRRMRNYSPERRRQEMSPPPKRVRGGWNDDDRGGYGGGGGGYDREMDREYERPPPPRNSGSRHKPKDEDLEGFQPAMMSFKAFMQTQDDSISDEEGIKKYAEYKLEFKRQQLNEFFVSHKDEEWFKQKYHPEDSNNRKTELKNMLLKRLDVFQEFMDREMFKVLTLDGDKQDALIKVLDSVVIKLEGGTDFDLTVLDLPDDEEAESSKEVKEKDKGKQKDGDKEEKSRKRKRDKPADSEPTEKVDPDENARLLEKAKEFLDDMSVQPTEDENKGEGEDKDISKDSEEAKEEVEPKADSKDGDDSMNEDEPKKEEEESKGDEEDKKEEGESKEEGEDVTEKESDEKVEDEGKVLPEKDEELSDDEQMKEDKKIKDKEKKNDIEDIDAVKKDNGSGSSDSDSEDEKPFASKDKPRSLHKTMSIFLRNLAPTITKSEVEGMCKRYDGFLRASIADPAPDRRWFRRGWVTFRRDVKIKEICFNLNNTRLKDSELGPIVNRDLTRRIRTVPGLTCDKKVVRNDIKLAAKIITNLDTKWSLWQKEKSDETIGLSSSNPLLANITDYLIEEASAEEEELLGHGEGGEEGDEGQQGVTITRDDELINVLDKMVLYLRIVHSVDFYNHSEYPNEDEMPNRCGILHARGIPPTATVTNNEVDEYIAGFEKKMGGFLVPRQDLTDEEATKLGLKNEKDEVDKFVSANTQELAKDKWLCPLSGKKFKGPEFVNKHIFNKHGEKVEEVKKEVKFFNSYLKDPRRPQLPEHPTNKPGSKGANSGGGSSARGGEEFPRSRDATKYPVYGDRSGGGDRAGGYDREFRGDRGYRGNHPPRRDPYGPPHKGSRNLDPFAGRPVITYRDWDAPGDEYY